MCVCVFTKKCVSLNNRFPSINYASFTDDREN